MESTGELPGIDLEHIEPAPDMRCISHDMI